jgi:hypothetical protein
MWSASKATFISIAVAATDVAVYKALKVLQPYLVRAL